LFAPEETREEIRGGGNALRQVNHILAAPLPPERLILFEVYVPGGQWSGWPPHCHDGYGGSPYLEEIYYYQFSPAHGFGIHRNYRRDTDFDEVFAVRHGDLVVVAQGFHPTATSPGSNMYFLNYLAGDLRDEARATPPLDDPDLAWMKQDWDGKRWSLPLWPPAAPAYPILN
jgi:5-deoxy-glucuronate isomerase